MAHVVEGKKEQRRTRSAHAGRKRDASDNRRRRIDAEAGEGLGRHESSVLLVTLLFGEDAGMILGM